MGLKLGRTIDLLWSTGEVGEVATRRAKNVQHEIRYRSRFGGRHPSQHSLVESLDLGDQLTVQALEGDDDIRSDVGSAVVQVVRHPINVASVVLASRDDETLLHGPTPAESSLRWMIGLGASEVILRDGPAGAYVGDCGGGRLRGGYLAGRLAGQAPVVAARLGNAVAGVVIQHPGGDHATGGPALPTR